MEGWSDGRGGGDEVVSGMESYYIPGTAVRTRTNVLQQLIDVVIVSQVAAARLFHENYTGERDRERGGTGLELHRATASSSCSALCSLRAPKHRSMMDAVFVLFGRWFYPI